MVVARARHTESDCRFTLLNMACIFEKKFAKFLYIKQVTVAEYLCKELQTRRKKKWLDFYTILYTLIPMIYQNSRNLILSKGRKSCRFFKRMHKL